MHSGNSVELKPQILTSDCSHLALNYLSMFQVATTDRCSQAAAKAPVCTSSHFHHGCRCHFGPCPPCHEKCGHDLACGHQCPAACHDAKPPAILDFATPLPPSAPGYINIRQRADEPPAPFPSQLVGTFAPFAPVYSCRCRECIDAEVCIQCWVGLQPVSFLTAALILSPPQNPMPFCLAAPAKTQRNCSQRPLRLLSTAGT